MADTTNDLIAEARNQAFGTIQIAAFEKTNIGDDATAGVLFADADMIEKLADALIVSLAERDELRSQLAEWIADRADHIHGHSRWEGNPVSDTIGDLIAFMHARNRFDYDECQHGTYSGGPSHGEPYKMCERRADAILASGWLAARKAEWQAEALEEALDRLLPPYGWNLNPATGAEIPGTSEIDGTYADVAREIGERIAMIRGRASLSPVNTDTEGSDRG